MMDLVKSVQDTLGTCGYKDKNLWSVLILVAHILKIRMIQRRLEWPLCEDDMQICELTHIFKGIKK